MRNTLARAIYSRQLVSGLVWKGLTLLLSNATGYLGKFALISVCGPWVATGFSIYDYLFNTPYALFGALLRSSPGMFILAATGKTALGATYVALKGTSHGN